MIKASFKFRFLINFLILTFVSAIPSKIPKPKVDHPIISKFRIILKSYKCIKNPTKTIAHTRVMMFPLKDIQQIRVVESIRIGSVGAKISSGVGSGAVSPAIPKIAERLKIDLYNKNQTKKTKKEIYENILDHLI